MSDLAGLKRYLARQVQHWLSATARLRRLDDVASPEAWGRLEAYLGMALRDQLRGVVRRLDRSAAALSADLPAVTTARDVAELRRRLLRFRNQYLRAETTVDFFAEAINSRTNPTVGAVLRACDTLAYRAMREILEPLGRETPVALTYLDKGLGASILKAGLRLWDGGSPSAVAAIKVVRHNLDRPTALVHEAGHQVAHILDWNRELAHAIQTAVPGGLGALWADWASEIAADAIAFVHTGFGSVLALHDVVAGEPAQVFRIVPGDPHPMGFLRIELGIECCRLSWGRGPWDELRDSWRSLYPPSAARAEDREAIERSIPLLPAVARATLATSAAAFGGRALNQVIDPGRVSPAALGALERRLGPALYRSPHWIWTESLRLLALSALRTEGPTQPDDADKRPRAWMLRLGGAARAA